MGTFEDDDDSVYTNYDFSKYDFAVDSSDTSNLQCSSGKTHNSADILSLKKVVSS